MPKANRSRPDRNPCCGPLLAAIVCVPELAPRTCRERSNRPRVSAKRRVLIPLPVVVMGAVGAGNPTKWAPPSVVRTIEVQTGLLHGASPSSQYWSADMAVNESGSKPDGTGPPAACDPAAVLPADTSVVGRARGLDRGQDSTGRRWQPWWGEVLGVVVVGGVLVAAGMVVVGATEVAVAGAVVVVAVPWDALLPPPPQPAARTAADSNAAGQ